MLSHVLMVCIGNICRSPMAEAVLAERARVRGIPLQVSSAGISALVGEPADPHAVGALAQRGMDLSRHRARQLTADLLARNELVLVMETGMVKAAEGIFPAARGRVHAIGKFGKFEVRDPYRGSREDFLKALELIERGVADFERTLWS